MAALSVFVALLLAVGSNAATAPSSQCAYLLHYFPTATSGLFPSLLPSISSKCLTEYTAVNQSSLCVPECQSLYSTYSQCASFYANLNIYSQQCGQFHNSYCPTINDFSQSDLILESCNNSSHCSPSCTFAIASVEAASGCCNANVLNGPKVLCGQSPIAPCPSVINGGSVAAPSKECAYISGYLKEGIAISELASLTPTLSSVCRATLSRRVATVNDTDICITECQSLYALLERCYDGPTANTYATLHCGMFNKQNCSSLYLSDSDGRSSQFNAVVTSCYNATYCSPECRAAITALEQYGGCCYAGHLNGPKVLCGQQPIPYCSTIINGGSPSGSGQSPPSGVSAAIGISDNIFLMISMAVLFL